MNEATQWEPGDAHSIAIHLRHAADAHPDLAALLMAAAEELDWLVERPSD